MTSLSTRQRIFTIICCLLLVYLCVLSFGPTLIFTCGTVLGVWCALKLGRRSALFQYENVIPFLPHVAKQRPLFHTDNEKCNDEGEKTIPMPRFNGDHSESQPTILQTELNDYVRLMMRDFVVGWYRILSDDDQFSHNVFHHFKDMIKNIKNRFIKIDQRAFLCILLNELRAHVDIFRRLQMSRSRLASKSSKLGSFAKKHSVVSIYETFAILHPALQNEEAEKEHLSQLSNTLILALLPSDVIHCDSLVFLLQDILINNVLQPLVHLISDPDFLNEAFILILMDEPLGQYHRDIDADGKPSANAKQELTRTGTHEMEPESNCEEAARNHDDKLLRDSDIVNHDVDIPSVNVVVDSMEISEKSNTTSQVEKTNSSGTQDTMDKIQNPSDNEAEQKPQLDGLEGDKKALPSPCEVIEPPHQFTFPMPMTMLEPSKAIPRQDSDTVSTEDGLDEESEEVDLPSLGTTRRVKTHRRSASTGSNIIAIQNPVSQSVGSVMDGVKDSMATDDAIQSSRFEAGIRSCFSANCLTDLGDCVPTSQETVSTLGSGTSGQSISSLTSSNEMSSSSKISEQEERDTDGHLMNAGKDDKLQFSSQGTSPSHR